MPRRRRRSGPPRCRHCSALIAFFRAPATGRWMPFNPKPVDPFTPLAYPVMERRAWDPNDLMAEIQVMRGVDGTDAYDEIRDLDWHELHRCVQGRVAWRRDHLPENRARRAVL